MIKNKGVSTILIEDFYSQVMDFFVEVSNKKFREKSYFL